MERTVIIQLTPDLSWLRVQFADGSWSHPVKQPLSLFSPAYRLVAQRHDPVPSWFVFRYADTFVKWRVASGVWPPTIESYLLIAQARRTISAHEIIWDVGCGTGVVGLTLKQLLPEARVFLSDRELSAVRQAQWNCREVGIADVTVAEEAFPSQSRVPRRANVIVSNPPFFPTGFVTIAKHAGKATDVSLLRSLLIEGWDFADRLLIVYSSVSERLVRRLVEARRGVHTKCLVRRRLPIHFDVSEIGSGFRDAEGLWLSDSCAAQQFWHDVIVTEFCLTGNGTSMASAAQRSPSY